MKYWLVLILTNLILINSNAQVEEIWRIDFSFNGDHFYDTPPKIKFDNDGNIILVGNNVISKISNEGTILWSEIITGEASYLSTNNHFDISETGNIYVTSTSETLIDLYNINYSIYTAKFNSDGFKVWEREFVRDSIIHYDRAGGIVVSDSNNIYVAGTTFDLSTDEDILLLKYDSLGNLEWYRKHNDEDDNEADRAHKIVLDSENNILIGGRSRAYYNNEYYLVKYNSDGEYLWRLKHDFQGHLKLFNDMDIDKQDNVYLTGSKFTTIKVNSEGEKIWDITLPSETSGGDEANVIKIDADDSILISGRNYISNNNGIDVGILTMKVQNSGETLWVNRFDRLISTAEVGIDLWIEDGGEKIFIAGYSNEIGEDSGLQLQSIESESGNTEYAFFSENINNEDDRLTCILENEGNLYVSGVEFMEGEYRTIVRKFGTLTSIKDFEKLEKERYLYPNPVNKMLCIIDHEISSELNIKIFDSSGKLVKDIGNLNEDCVSIETLQNGIYFAKIIKENKIITEKFLKIK